MTVLFILGLRKGILLVQLEDSSSEVLGMDNSKYQEVWSFPLLKESNIFPVLILENWNSQIKGSRQHQIIILRCFSHAPNSKKKSVQWTGLLDVMLHIFFYV